MKSIFSNPYYIHLTSTYIKLHVQKMLKESGNFDITAEQYGILYMLTKEDGLYQRQFSKMLMKDRPNITRMLDILENKKLLYRESDPNDRRIFKVFITDEGRELINQIAPVKEKILKEVMKPLSKEETKVLMGLLAKVRENLEPLVQIQT